MEDDMAHLDDLMHSILYITGQSGRDGIGEVGDPKRFCGILGGVRNERFGTRTARTP
jgi:hypothetical protein